MIYFGRQVMDKTAFLYDLGYEMALDKIADLSSELAEDSKELEKVIKSIRKIDMALKKYFRGEEPVNRPGVLRGIGKIYRALFWGR